MASKSKQYKNVYTILEKVKKGEIQSQSYYKDKDGLFGRLNFYKKSDLVKPYIHYIDEGKICLLYTSPSPRDRQKSRMPSSA